jgi:hypothetical protein
MKDHVVGHQVQHGLDVACPRRRHPRVEPGSVSPFIVVHRVTPFAYLRANASMDHSIRASFVLNSVIHLVTLGSTSHA